MDNTQKYREQKRQEYEKRRGYYHSAVKKYNGILEHISGLYKAADQYQDDPDGWLQKAEIFGMILEKVGELHYISIQAWKYAESLKKETYALAMIEERPKGRTADVHREMAVLESQEWRFLIGEWEGYTKRWDNAKTTIEEQIRILKWRVKWELANRDQHNLNNPHP